MSEANTIPTAPAKKTVGREIAITDPPAMPPWGIAAVRYTGLALSKLFFGVRYIGKANIPQTRPGGLLVCANHQTYFDPFWVGFPIKRDLRYMAWDEATQWFAVGSFIRALGAFPVNIERGGKESFKISLGWLKAGGTLMIFPEGGRGLPDGEMLEFKSGAVRIALQANVPILPVTIRGGNRVWSQEMKTPRPARVEVEYHPLFELPPAPPGKNGKTHAEELTAQLRRIIGSGLEKGKKGKRLKG